MKVLESILVSASLLASACSCARDTGTAQTQDVAEPLFMNVIPEAEGGYSLVSISPFDGSRDTIAIGRPLSRLIVMSTSHIGFLDAIGADSVIVGVSGGEYVCDTSVTAGLREGTVADIGYEVSPDYEKIMALRPDLLLTYSVSPVRSQFLSKIESMGIKTFIVNEHLERHPLARAAYVRLFGALAGNMAAADSVLEAFSEDYTNLRDSVQGGLCAGRTKQDLLNDTLDTKRDRKSRQTRQNGSNHEPSSENAGLKIQNPRKILVNIPYKDQWFVPGQESYLTTLFKDAGGEILGAMAGGSVSGKISVETAYSLSKDADLWMNVGWCRTLDQLLSVNPLFEDFLRNIQENAAARGYCSGKDSTDAVSTSVVWNDNKRLNSKGGNDLWESGVVRPDLLLRDLIGIFSEDDAHTPIYYKPIR